MSEENPLVLHLSERQEELLELLGISAAETVERHLHKALDVYLANQLHRVIAQTSCGTGDISLVMGATRSGKTALLCHRVNRAVTFGRNVIVFGGQELVAKAIQSACEVNRERDVYVKTIDTAITNEFIFVYPVDMLADKANIVTFWKSDKGYALLELLLSHVENSSQGTDVYIDGVMVAELKHLLAFFVDMASRVEDVSLHVTCQSYGQIEKALPEDQVAKFLQQFNALLTLRCADVATAEKLSEMFAANGFDVPIENLINQEPNSCHALLLPGVEREAAECREFSFVPPPYSHLELQRISGGDTDVPLVVVASVPKMMRRLIGED